MTVADFPPLRFRLTRLDEVYPESSIYFITSCTHERRTLPANTEVHDSFRYFCTIAGTHHVMVGRYVIMPDHLHFFVHFGGNIQLSVWMKSLKNSLSKTLRNMGETAPHWQKGYFDHVVRSEQSYEEKCGIMHLTRANSSVC